MLLLLKCISILTTTSFKIIIFNHTLQQVKSRHLKWMECTLKIILCLAILIWCMRKAAVSLQAEPLPHWSSKQRLLRSLYTVVSRVKPRPWKVSFATLLLQFVLHHCEDDVTPHRRKRFFKLSFPPALEETRTSVLQSPPEWIPGVKNHHFHQADGPENALQRLEYLNVHALKYACLTINYIP